MFVATGARAQLRDRRREEFADQYVQPLLAEAHKLGIEPDRAQEDDRRVGGETDDRRRRASRT